MKNYIDVDLSFKMTENGDIRVITDDESIKNSIIRLSTLELHDIPFNDYINTDLKSLMFENEGQINIATISKYLNWLYTEYEPRINVIDVDVQYHNDGTGVSIDVLYYIIKTNKQNRVVIPYNRNVWGVIWQIKQLHLSLLKIH